MRFRRWLLAAVPALVARVHSALAAFTTLTIASPTPAAPAAASAFLFCITALGIAMTRLVAAAHVLDTVALARRLARLPIILIAGGAHGMPVVIPLAVATPGRALALASMVRTIATAAAAAALAG